MPPDVTIENATEFHNVELHKGTMKKNSFLNQAEHLIRETGDRATVARVRILAYLLAQHSAVTHHQIELTLERHEKIDRVTLYRVLDWLAEKNLVHKVVSDDRVWRFKINEPDTGLHQHGHFKCNRCAKVICLEDVRLDSKLSRLPAGYQGQAVELTIKGLCPSCT